MSDTGRKPDYNVWAAHPDETSKGKVGAAWINEDQTINIKLDPFVVLEQIDNLTIKLFPNDGKYEERKTAKKERKPAPVDSDDDPF